MDREHPGCPFERYADDVVVHCDTEAQARQLRDALAERLGSVGLELHPGKTKIVYCQDANRRGEAEHTSFDFLGYTFRGRLVRGRRGFFVSFAPAMSTMARKAKGRQIRAWHLNRRSGSDLSGLAQGINPQVRGWINYYGAFYRSMLYSLAGRIDEHLVRWAMQKFKRLRGRPTRARRWLDTVRRRQPTLFAHWCLLPSTRRRTVGAVNGRPSRTVLREREGEAPSRYSPGSWVQKSWSPPVADQGRRDADDLPAVTAAARSQVCRRWARSRARAGCGGRRTGRSSRSPRERRARIASPPPGLPC